MTDKKGNTMTGTEADRGHDSEAAYVPSDEAVQLVTEWLDDDEQLRIPDTPWGRTLYDSIRSLAAAPDMLAAHDEWTIVALARLQAARAEIARLTRERDEARLAELRACIDFAHEERRQGVEQGRADETMTLFQHWSAAAGWLASRLRGYERGLEPDWPDAARVNAALAADRGTEEASTS